jgi:mono/diheme cytochrome c family protein
MVRAESISKITEKITVSVVFLCFLSAAAWAQKKTTATSAMVTGKAIYTKYCMQCHQVDGTGAQNMIPPLIKTEYVLGNKDTLIKIILKGMSGEVNVNGDLYSNEMPAHNYLKDEEIAAVLTYVRNSFGNNASTVTTLEVKKTRTKS